jgi:hypothetical protein
MTKKKLKSAGIIVLINLAIVASLLYCYEFFFDPRSGMPRNGFVGGELYTWGYLIENNRFGYREREFEVPKPPGTYRIMVLGDSLTWGAGLSREERYTAIAEALLNEAVNGGGRFEVLNFGISGGPTIKERDILRELKDTVDPDLIVVGFCINDPQPHGQSHSAELEKLRSRVVYRIVRETARALRDVALDHVASTLFDGFFKGAERVGVIPHWEVALDRVYQTDSPDWQDCVQALQGIRIMSDELGLPAPIFAALNQGVYADRPTDFVNPDEHLELQLRWLRQAEAAARTAGFKTHNHEREIAAQLQDEPLGVNRFDNHPSANLNRIYGQKLYEAVMASVGDELPAN